MILHIQKKKAAFKIFICCVIYQETQILGQVKGDQTYFVGLLFFQVRSHLLPAFSMIFHYTLSKTFDSDVPLQY